MKIVVEIEYETPHAKEICDSIKVDNVELPQGMEIKMNNDEKKNKLLITVSMEIKEPKNILTLRNTIDEIMQHISAVEKTLNSIK